MRSGEADSPEGKWSLGLAGSTLSVYEQESGPADPLRPLSHPASDMNPIRRWENGGAGLVLLLCLRGAGPESLSGSLQDTQPHKTGSTSLFLPPLEKPRDAGAPASTKGCP